MDDLSRLLDALGPDPPRPVARQPCGRARAAIVEWYTKAEAALAAAEPAAADPATDEATASAESAPAAGVMGGDAQQSLLDSLLGYAGLLAEQPNLDPAEVIACAQTAATAIGWTVRDASEAFRPGETFEGHRPRQARLIVAIARGPATEAAFRSYYDSPARRRLALEVGGSEVTIHEGSGSFSRPGLPRLPWVALIADAPKVIDRVIVVGGLWGVSEAAEAVRHLVTLTAAGAELEQAVEPGRHNQEPNAIS